MHFARMFPRPRSTLPWKKTLETKPQLIQHFGGVELSRGRSLGRNQYVEFGDQENPSQRRQHQALSRSGNPVDMMAEAIVMDGGKRGQVVKVCADPTCPCPPSQHALSAASRAGAGRRTEAHRKGEIGPLRPAIESWLRSCNAYRLR